MKKYKIQKCNKGFEILECVENNKPYEMWKYLKIYFPTIEKAQAWIDNHG
ncbi:MAG: hypothetical protein KH373_01915 [Ruminococcus sp.]|nr:hypothetical protein [Ruminococcus sp.]